MADEMRRPPVHPGRVLLELFMEPLGLSQSRLAEALNVDPGRINRIVTGKSGISADTALRLARYFGTTPEVWMNLQSKYDLEVAKARKAAEIQEKVQVRPKDMATVSA
ncbi:MAG: HigA family addiction module antidote protein [Deltaproteobacteria bacterium]|nr:HigA family addiction module antidote protein [Deltaproteobacteria bacterium]